MKFRFGSFFLFVLLIQLLDSSLAKKKELQTLALGLLLGSHRNNNNQPQLIPLHPYGAYGGQPQLGYGSPQ